MKKFLTVLLVIAVMFTFSFGSAFATPMGEENYSASIGDPSFETMWADAVKITAEANGDKVWVETDGGGSATYIDKAVLAGFKAEAKALYDYYMTYVAPDYLTTAADLLNYAFNFDGDNLTDADAYVVKQEAFKLTLAKAQFAAEKAEALAIVGSVPTYNYSTEVMSDAAILKANSLGTTVVFTDKGYTYQKAAELLVEYYEEKIEDVEDTLSLNADANFGAWAGAAESGFNTILADFYPMGYATFNTATPAAVTGLALTGTYDFKDLYTGITRYTAGSGFTFPKAANGGDFIAVGKDVNDWYAETVEVAGKINAASVAAVKAQNAAYYADYVSKNPTKVKFADKWLKLADILAEEGWNYTGPKTIEVPANAAFYEAITDEVIKFETYAAKWGAEKNAQGELVRDPAVVKKIVEKGVPAIAVDGNPAAKCEEYKTLIDNAVSTSIAAKLTFTQDSVKKAVELLLAQYAEDETYFAAELAEVQEIIDEYLADVAAAEEDTDAYLYDDILSDINSDVDKADDLVEDWIDEMGTASTDAAYVLYNAANQYVTYVNTYTGDTTVTTDDLNDATLKTRIAKMMGESGLRTEKELKTLKEQAVAVAQGLPTNAEVTAAKKAVTAAVKALPAKVTVADLALVQAVSDAIDAYELLETDRASVLTSEGTAYATAVDQLVKAYQTQFAQAYAKVAKTDEAALKALYAEIDAVVETLEDLDGEATTTYFTSVQGFITTALGTIRTNEDLAVEKLIAAIPVNVTEADKAAVEAARAAYDAYVAKYTDLEALYYYGLDGVAAGDYTVGYAAADIDASDLTAAETVLGLNDNSEEIAKIEAIASVEGLKITAKSSAKKGAITVKWTVEGDDANVQYYEVRKSTKKNSGYGTKPYFTTTKMTYKNTKGLEAGTRYYFKVRAVAEIDGEVYVSDWSNKAYRVAK